MSINESKYEISTEEAELIVITFLAIMDGVDADTDELLIDKILISMIVLLLLSMFTCISCCIVRMNISWLASLMKADTDTPCSTYDDVYINIDR